MKTFNFKQISAAIVAASITLAPSLAEAAVNVKGWLVGYDGAKGQCTATVERVVSSVEKTSVYLDKSKITFKTFRYGLPVYVANKYHYVRYQPLPWVYKSFPNYYLTPWPATYNYSLNGYKVKIPLSSTLFQSQTIQFKSKYNVLLNTVDIPGISEASAQVTKCNAAWGIR